MTKPIADEIAELRGMDVPALVARYEELWGKAPRLKNREALFKRCAWKLQEIRMGGLSEIAKRSLESLIAQIRLPEAEDRRTVRGTLRKQVKPGVLSIGTVITRVWHGQTICLKVVEGGYDLDGVVHKSLSAAAKALTGCHWDGRLFWGLKDRRRS